MNLELVLNSALLLATFVVFAFSVSGPLHMFQQNRYEIRRYVPWLITNRKLMYNHVLFLIGLLLIIAIYFEWQIKLVFLALVVIIAKVKYDQLQKKYIKPLIYTMRVKRQVVIFNTLLLTSMLLLSLTNDSLSVFSYAVLIFIIATFIYPIMIVVAFISIPIEKYIQRKFIDLAKKRLMSMPNLIKIGITGSYGKTSSKHILNDVLCDSFYTLMTPASYNTPMGITITIREHLSRLHEVFIIEMGADKVGEISYLMNMNHPKYGIVTSIGPQHLNTFKTLDNIIHEKMQMIERLPSDGVGFLNMDDENIANYKVKNDCRLVTYAIDNDADFRAVNIQYTTSGSVFDVVCPLGTFTFKTKLLGTHNIYNILCSIALACELKVEMSKIQYAVTNLQFVKHRLELKKQGDLTIIDNAFNSNPKSAKMSLEVLSRMDGYRIVCTPGMIELGSMQKKLNYEFGTQMKDTTDFVILVGKQQTQPIYAGLKDIGYDMERVVVCDTVSEAFNVVYQMDKENKILLLENDLPDAFNK